ncbi:MAG TPA: helical backbone metal receptor [Candidatus Polarisedimenticolia bacterium]|jgi:iron complex transport system substrate-binding protein|nr:helical backbone metal receptor [Candidatus Polarisedimenticolia bacterium]
MTASHANRHWIRALPTTALLVASCLPGLLPSCRREAPERTRAVHDGLGRTVMVPLHPRRIVSLAPSVTDSLFALGAQGRVVGVSDFCELPAGSAAIARVGGLLNPSLETIRSLEPDLLIGTTSGNDPSLSGQAAALGLPLYTIDTPNVERVLGALRDLASLLGEEQVGNDRVGRLQARLDTVRARVSKQPLPRILFIVWGEPLVVPGRSAFLTDALAQSGGESITADAPAAWPSFDVESAIGRAPEVILTTPQNRDFLERMKRDPAWASVPAVRSGRLLVVSEAIERPGPRVVAGIEEVARALHPAAFPEAGP